MYKEVNANTNNCFIIGYTVMLSDSYLSKTTRLTIHCIYVCELNLSLTNLIAWRRRQVSESKFAVYVRDLRNLTMRPLYFFIRATHISLTTTHTPIF